MPERPHISKPLETGEGSRIGDARSVNRRPTESREGSERVVSGRGVGLRLGRDVVGSVNLPGPDHRPTTPGRKPAIEIPADTPKSLFRTVHPVFVAAYAAEPANLWAVPGTPEDRHWSSTRLLPFPEGGKPGIPLIPEGFAVC